MKQGEGLRGRDSSGGGYGDPLDRDPQRVHHDVLEGWESRDKARDIYGVVLTGEIDDDSLAIDDAATAARRDDLRARRALASAHGASVAATEVGSENPAIAGKIG